MQKLEKKTCVQIGCSQAKWGKKCPYKNCEFHPNYDAQYVTKNLCNHPKTWWTCLNCGEVTCRGCHAFKLPTVTFCINCFSEWLKKRGIKTEKELRKKLENYLSVGKRVYDACVNELEKET